MDKVFAYVRVSGKGQLAGDGFRRQRQAIEDYCRAHSLSVARVFQEKGIAGETEIASRPALKAMLKGLADDGVRVVVIEKLDRLSRDLIIQETIVSELQKCGFQLVSTQEPDLLSADPSRVFLRQVLGAVAQLDKNQIVLRLRAAREHKRAKHGRCEGRKPFGHRRGEQKTIQRMQQLQAEGLTMPRIAEQLNQENYATRLRGRWHRSMVQRILQRAA